MRRQIGLLLCAVLLLAVAYWLLRGPLGGRDSPLVGKPAPAVKLPLLNGGEFRLGDHAGKNVVVLDFWATNCPPCIEELPLLAQLAADYQSKGVVVCAINEGQA